MIPKMIHCQMKKLSIVIPAYNVENYICRCLESICKQLQSWVEVLVIDDGSTDSTATHIISYVHDYPQHINYIKQDNAGPSQARNRGLELATGDFVWFVDADDYIGDSAIASLGASLEKFPETEVFFASLCHNGRKCCLGYSEDIPYSGEEFCLLDPSFYTHQMIYNKIFLKRNNLGFCASNNIEDFHFNMKVLYYAKSMRYIKNILYYYDNRPGSISTLRHPEHLRSLSEDTIFVLSDLYHFFSHEKACPRIFFQIISFNVNGLLYSYLRLGYPLRYIKQKLDDLSLKKLYPVKKTRSFKSKIFSMLSNRKYLFLFFCWINKKLNVIHE